MASKEVDTGRNTLFVLDNIELAFDRQRLCVEYCPKRDTLVTRVLDPSLMEQKVYELLPDVYRDLHGRPLTFSIGTSTPVLHPLVSNSPAAAEIDEVSDEYLTVDELIRRQAAWREWQGGDIDHERDGLRFGLRRQPQRSTAQDAAAPSARPRPLSRVLSWHACSSHAFMSMPAYDAQSPAATIRPELAVGSWSVCAAYNLSDDQPREQAGGGSGSSRPEPRTSNASRVLTTLATHINTSRKLEGARRRLFPIQTQAAAQQPPLPLPSSQPSLQQQQQQQHQLSDDQNAGWDDVSATEAAAGQSRSQTAAAAQLGTRAAPSTGSIALSGSSPLLSAALASPSCLSPSLSLSASPAVAVVPAAPVSAPGSAASASSAGSVPCDRAAASASSSSLSQPAASDVSILMHYLWPPEEKRESKREAAQPRSTARIRGNGHKVPSAAGEERQHDAAPGSVRSMGGPSCAQSASGAAAAGRWQR